MAVDTWQKEEILVIHEEDGFLVEMSDDEILTFWELEDTRYIGSSPGEMSSAQTQVIHPQEDRLLVREKTGYAKVYRRYMRVEILGGKIEDFLKVILPAPPA